MARLPLIAKGSGQQISYSYDAGGNRISKTAGGKTTLYVREAQGSVMSVYEATGGTAFSQAELHLYGSSRLGIAGPQSTAPTKGIAMSGVASGGTLGTLNHGEHMRKQIPPSLI